jgi:hypothetical protein
VADLTHTRYWVTDSQLIPADTSDIFDLAAAANKADDTALLHACEQVLEHESVDYFNKDFQSYRLAFRMENGVASRDPVPVETTGGLGQDADFQLAKKIQEEAYRALPPRKQGTAESSRAKRQRSSSPDSNDLYGWPSSSKKSRKEGDTSSVNSSESSVTMESDSLPLTSVPSSKSKQAPSPEKLRSLRLRQFMPAGSSQSKKDHEKPAGKGKKPVQVSISSGQNPLSTNKPRGLLKSLVGPTKFQRHIDDNNNESEEKNYTKDRGEWFLEHPGLEDQSSGNWTTAQDAELIRLKEKTKPAPTWPKIGEVLRKKFPGLGLSRPERHYDNMIRKDASTSHGNISVNRLKARKAALAFLDKEEHSKSNHTEHNPQDSDSDDEAEEALEDWQLGYSSSSATPWTTLEDAELIHMRERTNPKPSWQETVDALNHKFHARALDAEPRNYDNIRYRFRYLSGKVSNSANSLALRKTALIILDDDSYKASPAFEPHPGTGWTTTEDVELVKLRDQEILDTTWEELAEIFNARLHTQSGYKPRSGSSLYARYERIRFKWEESAQRQWTSMIDFARSGMPEVASSMWTDTEDAELVRLKEIMPRYSYEEIATAFNAHGSAQGWRTRSANALRVRYNSKFGDLKK